MEKVTFVAPAHFEPVHDRAFVHSMLCQTSKEYHAVICHNGQNDSMMGDLWDLDEYLFNYWYSPVDSGKWGTENRQRAIEECETEYIIQTSISDYWLPQAVEYINKILKEQQPDILIWNSINHLVGPCMILDAALEWSKVDWGNFAIRTDVAKKVGINHGDKYCADFLFIQDVLKSGLVDPNKIIKMNGILTIHN